MMKTTREPKSAPGDDALVLPGFKPLGARQVEAGAVRHVLAYQGLTAPHTGEPFGDALLFGLGGGIGLGYFVYQSAEYTSLFVGTRITTEESARPGFVEAMSTRVGAAVTVQNASSAAAAEKYLQQGLAEGRAPIVWVDPRALPYYGTPYAYHTLVVYGFDGAHDQVRAADRSKRPVVLTRAELSAARQSGEVRKFRAAWLEAPHAPKASALEKAVRQALRDTSAQMREGFGPPNFRKNFGLAGLQKWADLLVDAKDARGWPKLFPAGPRLFQALLSVFDQIENRGSGGSAFRPLYAEFLDEAAALLKRPALGEAAEQFRAAARRWRALGAALLPASVPLFAEARQLAAQRRTLFEKQGLAAAGEQEAVEMRLEEIGAQMAEAFPFSESGVRDLLASVREHVLAARAAEERAVTALQAAG